MRVVSPGDGTPDEFYYDGKTMTAYAPSSNLAAVADAPPTLDALIDAAWDKAAIYFPFSDVLASDPYAELSKSLKSAFYVGRSKAVGGVMTDMTDMTDMVAVATETTARRSCGSASTTICRGCRGWSIRTSRLTPATRRNSPTGG